VSHHGSSGGTGSIPSPVSACVTEEFMEERGIVPHLPKQPPAIAFLDLTG
jgi:hypothetical protein